MTLPTPLRQLLTEAYRPCANFGVCAQARWDPQTGHIPRGFLGAPEKVDDVEVVIVFAEPGFPQPGESYEPTQTPDEFLSSTLEYVTSAFATGMNQFHRNARWFLDELYPELAFEQQLKRVWMTEGRLCSIDEELGDARDSRCAQTYLAGQLRLFPKATIVACGGKAKRYLRQLGAEHVGAHAFAPPGCNQAAAKPSWQAAIETVRRRRNA